MNRTWTTSQVGWLLAVVVGLFAVIGQVSRPVSVARAEPKPPPSVAEQLDSLRRTSPPVGSVTAFIGTWPPKKADMKVWTEGDIGWLLCDGRKWDDPTLSTIPKEELKELQAVLGESAPLPNLQGQFLRGVDAGIDGKTTSGTDKDGIRQVGKDQKAWTALPATPFSTTEDGKHHHPGLWYAPGHVKGGDGKFPHVPNWGTQGATWAHHWRNDGDGKNGDEKYYNSKKGPLPNWIEGMEMARREDTWAGAHKHGITGGDKETRPVNVAVYWIVKFKHTAP